MSRVAIVVLGMHRSGTSALTWLLGRLGAALPADGIGAHADNARGYFESEGLVRADEQLLRVCRSSWFDPRPLDWQALPPSALRSRKDRMKEAIEAGWGTAPLIAIKDPRQCRFVQVIDEVSAEMGISARAVLVLRGAGDVAESLRRRDGTSAAYANLLWLRHMMDAERGSRGMMRAIVSYEGTMADWRTTMDSIAPLAGRQGWRPSDTEAQEIQAFLDPSLRHYSDEGQVLDAPLAGIVRDVEDGLNALISSDDDAQRTRLDAVYARFEADSRLTDDIIHDELRHRRMPEAVLGEEETTNTPPERVPTPEIAPPADPGDDAETIRQSGLFDADWYRATYPDVAASGLDPVDHYVRIGATEGRNPSPLFDTGFYARQMARRIGARAASKAAIHLHLFYPDIALELIGRVTPLAGQVDFLVTHAGPLDRWVAGALDALPGTTIVETPNSGWDIGPLLRLLPLIAERGYGAVAHLHSKKGNSGYAAEWRALAHEGLTASPELVDRIVAAFAADPDLALAGPAALYKSAASHQFRNGELLSRLAPALMAPLYPPADWGFFAGTFFWARPALLERIAPLARFGEGGEAERDGTLAHAVERLIGLAAVAIGGRIGLVDEDGGLETVRAPGRPSHEPIIRTLVDRAERNVAPLDPELRTLIAERNPLADYTRHGRDADALDPNPYFSSAWYNRIHEDVFGAGMHPLRHYQHHGWPEGRSTGPLFDGVHYRSAHDDVTGDPLRHFLEIGAREGRVAIPISRPEFETSDERPRRFYRHFDIAREEEFLRGMAAQPAPNALVSIIMPAWNREATIGAAIRSVLDQTYRHFELIVVDDGSTDGTTGEVRQFLDDPRVRLIEAPHGGVSAARNRGLAEARGEIVAYLDSDNRWTGWFLDVMARFMAANGLDAAYCGIALRDDLGQLTGYRGDEFDWEACLAQNYVDLNAFCHRRALIEQVGGFDESLRRMVDWDLILRIGKDRNVGYAPFVGCDYFDGKAAANRVTTAEPSAFQKLVATKNRTGLGTADPAFRTALRLSFAIKIAAPAGEEEAWGDWHFANALADAIRRQGHDVQVDLRENWTGRAVADEDVVIVLRGLIPYAPRPGQLAILWAISHPDQIEMAEYDRFGLVYVASESHAAMLAPVVRPPVAALPQATDPARFHPPEKGEAGPELLFVGNSRGVERDIVRWAIEAGLAPELHGGGWDGLVPDALVASGNADNRTLTGLYGSAGIVLNDHWPSMRAFGYLSNRLFDVVASGGRAVSDPVPSMRATFGDAVAEVDGPAALARAVAERRGRPRDLAMATRVAGAHSFDRRAERVVGDVLRLLGLPDAPGEMTAPAIVGRAPLRVHAIVPHGIHGAQSSAYIRLLAPLTDETVAGRVAVSLGRAGEDVPDCDVCIVQRTALPDVAAVDALVGRLGRQGAALVTDVDDAFVEIGPEHPEAAFYRPLNAALERAIAASAETWFSTGALAALYGHVAHRRFVARNAIDPRLWRDWRKPARAVLADPMVRMLCMGTATHGNDFATMRPALDRLWDERPGEFNVTVVGVAPDLAPAPWLDRLAVPAAAIPYPRFVHWLRRQGPFDLGLAPLADTAFNRGKSDIKLLDYAALGLLPVAADVAAYHADPALLDKLVYADDWHSALNWALVERTAARARAERAEAYLWAERSVAGIAATLVGRLEALA